MVIENFDPRFFELSKCFKSIFGILRIFVEPFHCVRVFRGSAKIDIVGLFFPLIGQRVTRLNYGCRIFAAVFTVFPNVIFAASLLCSIDS